MNLGLGLGLPFSRVAGASFVGPLDDYTANLAVLASAQYRLLSSWESDLLSGWRSSDSATTGIGYLANGTVDSAAAEAFAPSGTFNLTQLNDQTGSGRAFLPPAAANAPRLTNAGVWEGGMLFNGVTNFMDIASAAASNYTDGSNVQVVVTFNKASATNARMFEFSSGAIGAYVEFSGSLYWDAPEVGGGRTSVATPGGFFGANNIVSFEREGTTSRIRVNGTVIHTATVSGTISGTSIFRFGATIGASAAWAGLIRSIAIWKDCVNPADRAAAMPY